MPLNRIITPVSTAPADSLDPQARTFLDAGQLDDLDSLVMERLEQGHDELSFFLPILRALVRRKAEERAELLLQLITSNLQDAKKLEIRTTLSISLLAFWPLHQESRSFLIERLRLAYGNSPRFEQFLKITNAHEAEDPLSALHELERWLRYDMGRPVYMVKKGPGTVTDVNTSLSLVRVTLENAVREVVSMRIAEAERLLTPLAPGDLFYDMIVDPAGLRQAAQHNPAEIIGRLFASFPGSLTVTEIKERLCGVVGADAWPGWWKRAKDDRRLIVGPGARPVCTWRESAADAEATLIAQFCCAPLRERLKLAKTNAQRSAQMSRLMAQNLAEAAAQEKDPVLAFETVLTLEKHLGVTDHGLAQVADRALGGPDAARLTAAISDRALRRLALSLLKERRSDWERVYLDLLTLLDDASLLSIVYDALCASPSRAECLRLVSSILSAPQTAPTFYAWIGSEMPRRAELATFADGNFVAGLFAAISNENLKTVHTDLRQIFDGGGAVDIAVKKLDAEGARQFLAMVQRDTHLEGYRKDQLIRFIKQRFPDTQAAHKETFFVSPQALAEKRAEYERLVNIELPHNAREIKRTREYGDLRENFEYHAARARQEMLSSRAKTLYDDLTLARALEPSAVDTSAINVGTQVRLMPHDAAKSALEIVILGPWDSDPARNILSYLAPAVKNILGAHPGDRIEFNGSPYIVQTIEVWKELRC